MTLRLGLLSELQCGRAEILHWRFTLRYWKELGRFMHVDKLDISRDASRITQFVDRRERGGTKNAHGLVIREKELKTTSSDGNHRGVAKHDFDQKCANDSFPGLVGTNNSSVTEQVFTKWIGVGIDPPLNTIGSRHGSIS